MWLREIHQIRSGCMDRTYFKRKIFNRIGFGISHIYITTFSEIVLFTYANLFSLEEDFLQTLAEYVKSLLAFKQNPEYFWFEFSIRSSKALLDSDA